jgi:murein DD-endopeptidase MepM/ murein hydrolase activator NlpD
MDNRNREIPPGRKKRKICWMILGLSLLGIAMLGGKVLIFPTSEKHAVPDVQVSPPSKEVAPAPSEQVLAGKISKGQNLSSALRSQNLREDLVETICRHLKTLVNLRRIKPGDSFEVRLGSPEGKLLNFTYQASPLDIYQLTPTPEGEWLATKKEVPVEKYWARVSGEISTSLFEAMDQLGERDSLTMDFADIFAWEIDFTSDLQPGDRFEMVVEKYYLQDTLVRYGRILYADYQRGSCRHQAFFFKLSGSRGDYYTPQGQALRKALLRSPLKFTRISSGYSKSRHHPILGGTRPHLGVDYAAPMGSPVWAVADGTVVFCGWNQGFGKQLVIIHPQGYQSSYGHLSHFSPGMRKGRIVHQKQIIGYVGSTGLSTGPHLDFRLLKNGAYRNPLKEISPRAAPLTQAQLPEFKKAMEPVLHWLTDPAAPKRQKVASLTSRELDNSHCSARIKKWALFQKYVISRYPASMVKNSKVGDQF